MGVQGQVSSPDTGDFLLFRGSLQALGRIESNAVSDGYSVIHVRGERMQTVAELFAEFAAAFQFPWYFGNNWSAFDECMRDLDEWLPSKLGYVVSIWNSAEVLSRSVDASIQSDDLALFVRRLKFVADEWRSPSGMVAGGQLAPKEFRIFLHTEEHTGDATTAIWNAAGADVRAI